MGLLHLPMHTLKLPLVAAFICLLGATSTLAASSDGRQLINLNSGWKFLPSESITAQDPAANDATWQGVDLPHTWNGLDGQDGGDNYRRGAGWYRRHLVVDASLSGRRLYLQFDGASLMADVYVNGVHLGTHKGGFAKFRFDATSALHAGADNVIAVRVDNSQLGIPPASSDFTIFGGIYRSVWLLATDPVQVSTMDLGSPGVFIDQRTVSATLAGITVRAELENHGAVPRVVGVKVTVFDAGRAVVAESDPAMKVNLVPDGSDDVAVPLVIQRPHLWSARSNPYLYTVRVELSPMGADGAPGTVSDAVEQPLGLRTYTVDPDKGFILNGEYLNLYGFNRHQDWPDKGWAISDDEEAEDFALMMETGATAVRVSHYQQSDSWYDRCDKAGIVAWAEIPSWGKGLATPEYLESAKQQLRELIRQNYNHPSICFWSVGNETKGPASESVIVALAPIVRAEDPGRLSTYASDHDSADPKNWHTDVVSFNRYYGWYRGQLSDFAPWLDKTHSDFPKARFGMSEFGAGGSIVQHTDSTAQPEAKGPFHPEEYQNLYHEAYWAALKTRPYVWAKFIWCLHDFASDGRNEGDHPGRNDKGLVTYDRKVKKDAFYFYKANWSTEPVLHVTSCRFVDRTEPVTEIKVYSNAPQVTVVVNGVALGAKADPGGDRIFRWPAVTLSPGENTVVATANFGPVTLSDSCVWTLKPR
jgi:beta-galactosidase